MRRKAPCNTLLLTPLGGGGLAFLDRIRASATIGSNWVPRPRVSSAGNEPFYVHSPGDRRSLSIPAGSSATSPEMCFSTGDWHFRFVGRGSGRVRVTIRVRGLLA
jgi:hypothetical protein